MEKRELYAGFRWPNLRERYHFEDLGTGGRIILKRIFKQYNVRSWTNSPGSIKCVEFLT